MDENFGIHYDSDNYLKVKKTTKVKEEDNDRKDTEEKEKGQTEETKKDGSKSDESMQEM